MWLPEQDKFTQRKNELLDDLVVAMGGRVAEEIVFGDVTNGAVGDIRQATRHRPQHGLRMGHERRTGHGRVRRAGDEPIFLARDMTSRRANYSEDTAKRSTKRSNASSTRAMPKRDQLLLEHRSTLDALARALLEFETLNREHVREIMEHGRLLNPPQTRPPEPPPPLPQTPLESPAPPRRDESDDQLPPGELVPV